ncbi:MAG: septal ring lytic transglycosylase RlpA family protein [Rubritepida sp.]|nr:septal ring lytic transglycosylase RlpA family protein [Rubritepida sp.]
MLTCSGLRPIFSLLLLTLVLAALVGCASRPTGTAPGSSSRDGPEAVIPPDLQKVPNAEPRLEPIRKGGPNKPYEALNQRYEPMTADLPLVERGLASWYGKKFHGRPTSSGEVYNMYAMTGAHPTMPIPSYARVRNPKNGREVILRINDRGPFHPGRIIDLSYTAALKLDVLHGVAPIEVERITYEEIRSGAWRRGSEPVIDQPPVYAAAESVGAPQRETTATMASAPTPVPAAPAPMPRAAAKGFWIQLGAFAKLDGAETQRQQLAQTVEWLSPLLAVFKDGGMNRLQAGPYATREDARVAAERVRSAMGLAAVVVERK